MSKHSKPIFVLLACACLVSSSAVGKVRFDERGRAVVAGEAFFPIGIYTYKLDQERLTEFKKFGFNTVVAGFRVEQLPQIHAAGMKVICVTGSEWHGAAGHPALLGWYLMDEPESGKTVAEVREAYTELRAQDPNHPIGLVHSMFEAIGIFRDCADFTMPDIYPVTAKRDAPLGTVGRYVAEARRVHGPGWATWPFIQVFGGPDVDGGKWALPTPAEVRCMTFIAVVNGATGILYFSHWPQGGDTWRSLEPLNRDLQNAVPWLLGDAEDGRVWCGDGSIESRVIWGGGECLLIAVNTSRRAIRATIRVEGLAGRTLYPFGGAVAVRAASDDLPLSFEALEVKLITSRQPKLDATPPSRTPR